MDVHALEYFCQFSENSDTGHFHRVIELSQNSGLSWDYLSDLAPSLCKGWYELSRLNTRDRIDFIRDYWISKIPFHPHYQEFISNFFNSLDDIDVFITQKMFDSPYEVNLVYSLKNDSGFYHGRPGATPGEIEELKKAFSSITFPDDYLLFLQIHNGFSKATDTGIIPSYNMSNAYEEFQRILNQQDALVSPEGSRVNPKSLIPYYESFGLPCYHCFWLDWYPSQEMGNIYYSGLTNTISSCRSSESSPENLAFPTFIDWLMFYLEKIN